MAGIADSAQTRVAIIKEVTQGATPATPAFKTMRTNMAQLKIARPRAPADNERRADRMLATTYKKVGGSSVRLDTKFCEDDAFDIALESVMCNAWATDVLKNGSTKVPVTIEETLEQGATDTFLRAVGLLGNSMSFSGRLDQEIEISFEFVGMDGSTDTAIIASATYAAASTKKCHTVLSAASVSAFGLSSPKLVEMQFNLVNNVRPQPAWGSAVPIGIGLGKFRVDGSTLIYLESKAQIDAALANTEGQPMGATFGETAGEKYTFNFPNPVITDYEVVDGGNDNDVFLRLMWSAQYDASATAAISITRNV